MIENSRISDGKLYIDGCPVFAISGDYPYYRDEKYNWKDRLIRIKESGIRIITFYVPWRHHTIKSGDVYITDFEGKTQENRDVRHFIRLCRELELYIIIKPGPFIHAETDFGGLPDFVSPDVDESIEPSLSSRMEKRKWFKTLPSPLEDKYFNLVKGWYKSVDRELIRPNHDIIAAIQILNEGIYSDAQRSPMDYEFSASSIKLFRQYLEGEYVDIENYNRVHNTGYMKFDEIQPSSSFEDISNFGKLLQYKDWTSYQSVFMKEVYRAYGSVIDNDAPYVINLNPPLFEEKGVDYWLSRLEVEQFSNVSYGYTNWIGVVSHDKKAYERYMILTKRKRGINLEENWGFSHIYDSRYKYPIIPFYQTLLAIAGGASGFNIYTAVNTESWDVVLDSKQERPYPDSSPIDENGETGHKYRSMSLLNAYFNRYGEEFLNYDIRAEINFALYNGYANCASVTNDSEDYRRMGVKPVRAGYKGLVNFQDFITELNLDYNIINIKYDNILDKKNLILIGGFFMEASVQEKLMEYVESGETLFIFNDIPYMDEHFMRCTIIKDEIDRNVGSTKTYEMENIEFTETQIGHGRIVYTHLNIFEIVDVKNVSLFGLLLNNYTPEIAGELSIRDNTCSVSIYEGMGVVHHIVLSKIDRIYKHSVEDKRSGIKYEILLPSKGCAVIRFKDGKLTAALVKGLNEYEESYVCPEIRTKDDNLSGRGISDVLIIRDENDMFMREEFI